MTDFEGIPFEGMSSEPYIVACHPDNREAMLKLVGEGLGRA
ncbi:hypothetical protein ACFQWB_11555 [Paenibacillus thermoaerophilus]|uniref:Uncharacterized protein n=1 Tax=Paenibacillus thermoaerophilus TaxID=1215385 RepID=A0ABW2V6Z8_9BACL|nr:hypothetical protein [Paenibacillus thermoaerophilus]